MDEVIQEKENLTAHHVPTYGAVVDPVSFKNALILYHLSVFNL
jgi:hypothetical protein